ncbi:probable cytosolic oligopeptidase A [Olea europaea subsp. europaea]|uniref:Probable cytosolic oligopeptidase A n=1 Tax=Olea europaea subsp. europaea TaxID=158383 RepID=A0A8S0UFG8_OLEEU|nr:probable cytosolic oligopeptidase A [Olea europaea subsp. europaea]
MATIDKAKDLLYKLHSASWNPATKGRATTVLVFTKEPADGEAPVWNKDVCFYKIKDCSGSTIAYFYFDPYSCPSEKRGGAWMDVVVGRTCVMTPPTQDKPSLMTIREVEAVFHEFGHALQHML